MEPAASTSIAENPTKVEADVTKANSSPSAAPNSDTPLILDGDLRPTRADETRAEVGEDFFKAEQEWEALLAESRATRGLAHPATLDIAFALFDQLIALYRLERLETLLNEVWPIVNGTPTPYHTKAIQMRAFLRYKQFRYAEALAGFLEMQALIGDSVELLENMGHTYNAVGLPDQAEECFAKALELDNNLPASNRAKNRGGLLLGMGASAARRKNFEEALRLQTEAYEFYKAKFNQKAHSLQAKSLTCMATSYSSLGKNEDCIQVLREAVEVFIQTCTRRSPLTANAMHDLGNALFAGGYYVEAERWICEALDLHSQFDTMNTKALPELLKAVLDVSSKLPNPLNPERYAHYVPIVQQIQREIERERLEVDDNISVMYKYAGEISLMAGQFEMSVFFLSKAKAHFLTVTSLDCSGLVESCNALLTYIAARLSAS